jgi:hypothetical protein
MNTNRIMSVIRKSVVKSSVTRKNPAMISLMDSMRITIVEMDEFLKNPSRKATTGARSPALELSKPVIPETSKKSATEICAMTTPRLRFI